ncbi:uncharacterized protein LOC106131198 [Amyelois transitella]|uniref:uncharacterized protein LOC106131198 n=1 Tax=Amyelois transitella TaxID=680683 RepID=UPI00298FF545|nr:uncharacterized protein LOC106131198 [Amyelois transitella]
MAPILLLFFIINVFIMQAFSSQVQPTFKQYLITTPQPQMSTVQTVMPTSTKPSTSLSTLASLASLLTSGGSNLPHLLATAPPKQVAPTVVTTPEKPATNSVDMDLLNNLAIALQLMIVNNILASPTSETAAAPTPTNTEAKTTTPLFESLENLSFAPIQNDLPQFANQYQNYQPNLYEQHNQMPNSNFVGSSGFGDSNPFMGTVPPPSPSRSGLTLMSPYEALSPNSPYLDPILSSPYGSVMSSKKDFQSPYSSILGSDKDYFSMSSFNDLF